MRAFSDYTAKYGKTYATSEEYQQRASRFLETDKTISEWNANPERTHSLAHNKFSDWFDEEFSAILSFQSKPAPTHPDVTVTLDESNISNYVNWITQGAVGPVKDQGICGSCYTFATTAILETGHYFQTGELLSLSQQQIVSCAPEYSKNKGCGGGRSEWAMIYTDTQPLMTEEEYPYTDGVSGNTTTTCNYDPAKGIVSSGGFKTIVAKSPTQLQAALMMGPVAVAMNGENDFLRQYSCGIVSNSTACGTTLNHEVVAVGYNLDNDPPYYIVRNSWGPDWGNNGYFNIAIEEGIGVCAIQLESAFTNLNLAEDGSLSPREPTQPFLVNDGQVCDAN